MTPASLQVAHHTVALPKLKMHYVEKGSGPLVVLLHGFPESWWSWRYQIEAIANAGFRVVAPDLRGYGETDTHGPFDTETLADDVCALITSLGESRARIVGHDWGGAVAWQLATTRQDFVERLAVLNCPHLALFEEALIKRPKLSQLMKSWYFFFFLLPGIPEWTLKRNDGEVIVKMLNAASIDRSHLSEEELRPFRDNIQKPGVARAMVDWYRTTVKDGLAHPFRKKAWDDITARTLLIWGMKDPALGYDDLVPGTDRYVANLRIEQIPNAGHFIQSERPEEVNALLVPFLGA